MLHVPVAHPDAPTVNLIVPLTEVDVIELGVVREHGQGALDWLSEHGLAVDVVTT